MSSLTAEDLKDLGVNLVGHRRRLLDAIAKLSAEKPTVADLPARADAESSLTHVGGSGPRIVARNEAVRRAYPTHMMLRELEMCRKTLVRLHFEDDSAVPPYVRMSTPAMFAAWREWVALHIDDLDYLRAGWQKVVDAGQYGNTIYVIPRQQARDGRHQPGAGHRHPDRDHHRPHARRGNS